jgi:hypothetical protein
MMPKYWGGGGGAWPQSSWAARVGDNVGRAGRNSVIPWSKPFPNILTFNYDLPISMSTGGSITPESFGN